jgi:glucokinase
MILAGDIGGTKTLLGLFERGSPRPAARVTHAYTTNAFAGFGEILEAFARDAATSLPIEAAAVGVAGPVVGTVARLTNIVWDIDAAELQSRFTTTHVGLLNDLEALAHSVDVLTPEEVEILQQGQPRRDGNAAVIAAGTGLGQAYLHRIGGRLVPAASEGGHADFGARTDREIELLRMLRDRYGRAEVEHVLSGPGLVNLQHFTHRGGECEILDGVDPVDVPALVTRAALTGRCQGCVEALHMFVSAYGAEAGNLALRGVTTAGLYVGGGIAPKILPALRSGVFMDAFLAKPPMRELLLGIPVRVILNPTAGLLGAAVYAQGLADAR